MARPWRRFTRPGSAPASSRPASAVEAGTEWWRSSRRRGLAGTVARRRALNHEEACCAVTDHRDAVDTQQQGGRHVPAWFEPFS